MRGLEVEQERVSWVPPSPYYHNDNKSNNTDKQHASRPRANRESGRDDSLLSSSSRLFHQKPFLIYRPPLEGGQGVGNLMNGLLAAHWLGREFHCIVCVSPEWKDFHMAWESLTPECTNTILHKLPPRTLGTTVWILNYAPHPVNECQVKAQLQAVVDEDDICVYLVANDYPRWPSRSSIQQGVDWNDLYRPTLAMQQMWTRAVRPWDPTTPVVHLRAPDDDDKDHRTGLDLATRRALGERLSSHHHNSTSTPPFLVTNQVDYYTWFHEHYGWDHPSWTGVRHSALSNVRWTSSSSTTNNRTKDILQLWTDWWTLYRAKVIYHTNSDFSRSAARWSQCQDSYTIGGIDERSGTLLLTKDRWGDENVAPLSERRTDALRNCNVNDYGIGQVFNLDDGLHDDHEGGGGGDVRQGTAG